MSLSDLFFELSNDTRVNILKLVSVEPQRLTDISKHLDLPAQEISRQLSRLDKMSMVYKDSDGLIHVTPYSEQLLILLPSYQFLYSNKDYFTSHSMNTLPLFFTARVGELSSCNYEHDVMTVLHRLEGTLRNAEKYIHIMLDQMVSHTLPILEEKVKTGVEFHFLTTKNLNPPPGVWRRFSVNMSDLDTPKQLDTRFIDDVPIGLVLTEKEVGLISFKTEESELDYTGFYGADPSSHCWASDLFQHYWVTASDKWPEELLQRVMKDLG